MSEFNPTKYRKRPVVISAAETGVSYAKDEDIMFWCGGVFNHDAGGDLYLFSIPTLEGEMIVTDGDYVICGVQGEFYPCKPEIFNATYDIDLVSAAMPQPKGQRCFCGSPGWGVNGCCGTSGCNQVPG